MSLALQGTAMRMGFFLAICGATGWLLLQQAENLSGDSDTRPPATRETVSAMKPAARFETDGSNPAVEASEASDFEDMIAALQASRTAIQAIPAYQARLEHQAATHGKLNKTEFMDVKLRRQPFSVYLYWHADKQEAIYVEGAHDNRLVVKPTRGLAALRGVWRLRPDSAHAMKTHRYPVTELGIEKLTLIALDFHEDRNFSTHGMTCRKSADLLNDHPVTVYDVLFESPQASPEYARSILKFCDETGLLISLENLQWANGQPGETLERYIYHDFQPANLSDDSFDEKNPAYRFARS